MKNILMMSQQNVCKLIHMCMSVCITEHIYTFKW